MRQAANDSWVPASPEAAAWEKFERFVMDNRDELRLVAAWGDGQCGAMLGLLQQNLLSFAERFPPKPNPKKKIPRALAKLVFERDGYRCVTCGDHLDLCCDHVIAESKGGPTTFENLQTMCRPCNSRKGAQ